EKFPQYMVRHRVRAGITGWAQVHGWRGNTSVSKRIEYDLYYIENWSLALDGSLAPNLSRDGKAVLLSWLEPAHAGVKPQDGDYALRMSRLVGGRWSEPSTISAGQDFFANWADFPSVTSAGGGRLIAHWAAN